MLRLGLVAVAAAASLAGCRKDGPTFGTEERHGRPADELVINAGAEPEHLDPGKAADQGSALLALHLCEPLLAYHPRTGALVGGVAERYDVSADARRYRFHLREDARWSDGRPVTAADFVYAWRRVLTPETGSRAAGLLYVIAGGEALHKGRGGALGVRAAGERVLEVELAQPSPQFPEIAANVTACPVREDVVERAAREGRAELWTRPERHVGNGPFQIERARLRYELVLRASPTWHDAASLAVRRVTFTFVEDAQTALWLYRSGELDFFGNTTALPSASLPLLESKTDFRRFPYLATYWYELNARRPPFDDARVRRAFFLGVDRATLVGRVLPGGLLPAGHFVPDATGGGYAEALRSAEPFGEGFDPARGRALLAEAGYPVEREGERWVAKGFPRVELLYNGAEGHRLAAVAVQAMWEQHLGVRVALRAEEWKVVLAGLRRGDFDIGRYGWAAEYDHPHTFLEPFGSESPQNVSGHRDAAFDDALARASREPHAARAAARYLEAERLAVASASRVPLYFYTKSTLVQPRVRGFAPNPRNTHLAHWLAVDREPAFDPPPLPPPGRLE